VAICHFATLPLRLTSKLTMTKMPATVSFRNDKIATVLVHFSRAYFLLQMSEMPPNYQK